MKDPFDELDERNLVGASAQPYNRASSITRKSSIESNLHIQGLLARQMDD